jgi:hypothetical protein
MVAIGGSGSSEAILPPTEREKQKGPGETAGALSSHFLRGQGNRI